MAAAGAGAPPELSICVVTHNSASTIVECLDTTFACSRGIDCEVFLVDNASTDDTLERIGDRYPDLNLIRNPDNRGFARGSNQGIERSRGRYVLLLNPDIEVREGALETMIAYLEEHPDVGIAGCRLHYPDGELQLSCRRYPTLATFLFRVARFGELVPNTRYLSRFLMEDVDHERCFEVDWCLGSCLMVRREVIEQTGMLDERYFMYYEDIDLCFRIHESGWKVAFVGTADMVHHYQRFSASFPPNRAAWWHLRSAAFFFLKFLRQRGLRRTIY